MRPLPCTDRPLLNHIGVLVESLTEVEESVAEPFVLS
jgi:hypothetical protein